MTSRYHRPRKMGMQAIVKVRMREMKGVRMEWDNRIASPDGKELYFTGRVVLVSIDREKGKIVRKLPPTFVAALRKIRGI